MYLKTFIIFLMICATNGFNCQHLLSQLANQEELLIYCITMHSVPVTLCINCFSKYNGVLEAYDLVAANCSNFYFDKDRINMIASIRTMLTGLWSKAYCDNCANNNNSITYDEKNATFYDCLESPNGDPCEKCKVQYMDLNSFYTNLDQHNNGEVCYDLQDSMNRTRDKWSKELNCCRRHQNMTLFAITLCIAFSLPLLFYSSTYIITKRQERNHRVLNYEDPIYNSELPSSSRQLNINDINNPSESLRGNNASSSGASANNATATVTMKPDNKKGIFYLSEDLESSDDEMQIEQKRN